MFAPTVEVDLASAAGQSRSWRGQAHSKGPLKEVIISPKRIGWVMCSSLMTKPDKRASDLAPGHTASIVS
eukprot:2581489-Pyramimonas_sp.AAC.1